MIKIRVGDFKMTTEQVCILVSPRYTFATFVVRKNK